MKHIIAFVVLIALSLPLLASAQVTFPNRGGTGTSTIPQLGEVLVGQANGTYAPQATSTLGIAGGAGGSSLWEFSGGVLRPLPIYWGVPVSLSSVVASSSIATSSILSALAIGTTTGTHALTFASGSPGIALYNTADQTTNFERITLQYTGNVAELASRAAGTASARALRFTQGVTSLVNATLNGSAGAGGLFNVDRSTSGSGYSTVGITGTNTSGSGSMTGLAISPSFSQTGTAGYIGLLINPTETTVGSGPKLLIQAGTAANQSMFVLNNAGQLGIGTANPANKLTLMANANNETVAAFLNTALTNGQTIRYQFGRSSTSNDGFTFYYNHDTSNALRYLNIKPNESALGVGLQILANGNIGISTTTPSARLTIAGDMRLTGNFIDSSSSTGAIGSVLTVTEAGTQWVATSSLGIAGGVSSGPVYLASSTPWSVGSLAFILNNGTLAGTSSPVVGAITATSSTLPSTFAGSVGIGTTSPSANLAVAGAMRVTGTSTFSLMTPSRALFVDASNNLTSTSTSAALLNALSDETGTGVAVFATSPSITTPTFVTRATSPILVGGTAVGSSLTLQSTTGVGTTDFISFNVGNNGATAAGRITTLGRWGIGTTTPTSLFTVASSTGTSTISIDNSATTTGACIKMKDSDGVGYTFITANNGVLTASTVSCE